MTKFNVSVVMIVVMLVLMSVVAMADEPVEKPTPCDFSTGMFYAANGSYAAWTVDLGYGKFRWYEEVDTMSDYDLAILSYQISKSGTRAVLRLDDNKARVGASFNLPGGFWARGLVGEGPERLDVITPTVPITEIGSARLGAYVWFQGQSEGEQDYRVCPVVSSGRLSIEFDYNFNRSRGDFWFANYCLYNR